MNATRAVLAIGALLAAVGLWWLLPGSRQVRRAAGGVLAFLGFALLGSQVPVVGDWLAKGLFHAIAAATIVAAAATISFRSPVYCAIWFGMTLTGVAGLFLLAGAEFLAVATLVVYAGAILVTFLFVLMLAQPEGHTSYDRRSWEAMVSAFTGAALVGVLTMMIVGALTSGRGLAAAAQLGHTAASAPAASGESAAEAPAPTIKQLGAVLFTRNLVAVEVAGVLLFAALVGAAVIVGQGHAAGSAGPRDLLLPDEEGGSVRAS